MNKRLLLAAAITVNTIAINASDISEVWTIKTTATAYSFDLDPYTPLNDDTEMAFLEISKYADFTFIERAYPFSKGQCQINFTDIPQGNYYYRAAVYDKKSTDWCAFRTYAPDTNTLKQITNGTQEVAVQTYTPQPDINQYPTAELADGTPLIIESVWLRSSINGAPLMPTTPPGFDPVKRAAGEYVLTGTMEDYSTAPFDNFAHGAIVKDGVIYIGVGSASSFHPAVTGRLEAETLNPTPDRAMLYRYDLSTGEFLKPIRLTDENGKEFDYGDYRVMPWLKTDHAGTPYFICAPLFERITALAYSLDDAIAGYTLDFSKIVEGSGNMATLRATALKAKLVTYEDATSYIYGVIDGDVTSENYRLWGMTYNRRSGTTKADKWTSSFNTWTVANALSKNPVIININENPFSSTDEIFTSYTPKVYPLDDNHVYTHATPTLRTNNIDFDKYANYEPAFYKIDSKSSTLKNKLSDGLTAEMAPATDTKRMSGLPIIKIGDATIAAYGHISSQPNATAIQLFQIKDPEVGFESDNLIPLWDLYNETGLSDNLFQALDMTFIPAAEWSPARSGDTNLIGHLLVYASGAGMGLYSISADEEGAITNIPEIPVSEAISIKNGVMKLSSSAFNINIFDTQGRLIIHYDTLDTGEHSLPTLSSGLYLLQTPTGTIKFQI